MGSPEEKVGTASKLSWGPSPGSLPPLAHTITHAGGWGAGRSYKPGGKGSWGALMEAKMSTF